MRLGRLALAAGRPRLVGVVAGPGWEKGAWAQADLLEVRVDCLLGAPGSGVADGEAAARFLEQLRRETGKPLLLTVRRPVESHDPASAPRGDGDRLALYEALLPLAEAVDVEVAAPYAPRVARLARRHGCLLVGSWHDFARPPRESVLAEKMGRADRLGAAVFKVACRAEKPAEVMCLAEFCRLFSRRRLLAVLPMGRRAALPRLFMPLVGSVLVYASLEAATAPGQPDVPTLRADLARFFG